MQRRTQDATVRAREGCTPTCPGKDAPAGRVADERKQDVRCSVGMRAFPYGGKQAGNVRLEPENVSSL